MLKKRAPLYHCFPEGGDLPPEDKASLEGLLFRPGSDTAKEVLVKNVAVDPAGMPLPAMMSCVALNPSTANVAMARQEQGFM